MRILAVDLGHVRTGLAVCDEAEILATPFAVVPSYDWEKLLETLAGKAAEAKAQAIVVGLPRNMDGSYGESAENARAFAEKLKARTGLPVELWDERCTTQVAHRYLNDTNTRGKKRKAAVDAVAATVILQDYLASRRGRQDSR